MRLIALLFGLATAALMPLDATELYSWHSFDDPLISNKKVEVILHSRLRTRAELSDVQQVRFGPIVRVPVHPRLIWYTGYYFQPGDNGVKVWGNGHRVFSGVETPLQRGPLRITLRLAAERHFSKVAPTFNRYRSFTRVMWGKKIQPFIQNEWLAVNDGFHSVRNSAGFRVPFSAYATFEFGYLYDYRQAAWGGDRQAIVTSVRFERREK